MATTTSIGGGEDRVVATAHHILKSLRTSKDVTDDMLLILSSFDNRLSNISDLMNPSSPTESHPDLLRFESAERIIKSAHKRRSLWGRGDQNSPSDDVSCEYLAAIDEVLALMEEIRFQRDEAAVDRAEVLVESAMARLEREFRSLMTGSAVALDAERLYGSIRRVSLSFAEIEGEEGVFGGFEALIGGRDEKEGENRFYHERGRSLAGKEDFCLELIDSEVVADLREIAERMIRAGFEKECCQVYSSVRRGALDEYLGTLGVGKMSIEEIQRVEWRSLDDKMKKWSQSVKIMMKEVLESEKRLCEQVFEGWEVIKEVCFVETVTDCVMQMLNFGEAVAIGNRSPEKLFRILDMYDALKDALPGLQGLFVVDSGEFLCREAKGVLDGLGEAAKGTFVEFEKAVMGESSKKPIHGAEIHPLGRYVMNYVKLLVDYSETVNLLLECDAVGEEESEGMCDGDHDSATEMSPLGRRLVSLMGALESNLEEKSKMYDDGGVQWIFLMNNKLYIVQKVKDSDLGKFLGDDWVRRRSGLIRKYATNYLRASWSKALACLKEEGMNGSSTSSKMALKEKFKSFNANFEEIYRMQTACKVPDSQLRTELRISISEKVIPAYRAFLGRYGGKLESGRNVGRYIKYTSEDIEAYVGDLFEGRPAVLHHVRR